MLPSEVPSGSRKELRSGSPTPQLKKKFKNPKRAKDENYLVTTTYLFNTGIPNVYVNVINFFFNRMVKNSLLTFLSVFSHSE